ncbi:MAG: outer membrane lipoprotein carrier protein LolA [Balneolaceae bacterium]
MNWTSPDRYYRLWICMFFLSAPFMAVGQSSETPGFDKLKDRFEEGEVFAAAFSHQYHDSFTEETTSSEGEIWIGKDWYRVENEDQMMVVDGETSRVYDSIRDRLLISDYVPEEDDFAPSRMLQGVDESWLVEESADGPGLQIRMDSEDPFTVFSEITIRLNSEGTPLEIEAFDRAENRLRIRFRAGRFVTSDPALFELNLPEGTELIDLRY